MTLPENRSDSGRLKNLALTEENYPRAFFFRLPEGVNDPYEVWDRNFSRLMGFEAKALNEERPTAWTVRNPQFFSQFKKNHPDQMVLLHFNGLARKPAFKSAAGEFFAGHWLYYAGATIKSDVPATNVTTEIQVSDASQFFLNVGVEEKKGKQSDIGMHDEIGLCVLGRDGRPDWSQSEQVTLVAVDRPRNVITVKRAGFGTSPRSFRAGRAYAAVHCTAGPWGDDLLWLYNFSTACPQDANGNTCTEVLIDDLAFRFSEKGALAAFDGIEFDCSYWKPGLLNPKVWLSGHAYEGLNRQPDADADGKPDNCIINGINTYGEGYTQLMKKLRQRLGPDRIIMADGQHDYSQRAFGIMNGIENEGWPTGEDTEFKEWSDGINRLQFWNENSMVPKLTYINHRYWAAVVDAGKVGPHQIRLVIAASALTGTAYALFDPVEKYFGGKWISRDEAQKMSGHDVPFSTLYDELVMGQENRLGWLGKPESTTVLLAKSKAPVLHAHSQSGWEALIKKIDGPVNLWIGQDGLHINAKEAGAGKLVFTIKDLPVKDPCLTLFMTATAEPMAGYSSTTARLVWVKIPQAGNKDLNQHMTWVNGNPFESVFMFTPLASGRVDVKFEIESSEPVQITELAAYAEGDARIRAFENGVVLANPNAQPVDFNLATLFPGQEFRRIKGSPQQDPVANNGEKVMEAVVTLSGRDALFLIKE